MCPCPPFSPSPMCCLFGDKPRERDFLKTLRLVSGTEACAVEQHGDTVDDDKGVRVAHPPTPTPLLHPLCNKIIQSVLWQVNRDVETIPQSHCMICVVSRNCFSRYCSSSTHLQSIFSLLLVCQICDYLNIMFQIATAFDQDVRIFV